MRLDARLVSFACLLFILVFFLQENQVMITLLRAVENKDFHGIREEDVWMRERSQ